MKKIIGSLLLFLGAFALVSASTAGVANLTRFGPKIYERERGRPTNDSAVFTAVEGPAELIVQDNGIKNARVTVNGVDVVTARDLRGNGELVIPLHLYAQNSIEVSVRGKPGGTLGLRVRQFTESTLNVRSQMYFGINTSDMVKQRSFYKSLGLLGDIFPAGPPSCEGFAQSLGFEEDYLIFVELRSITGAPPWIDTVQFRGDSFRDDPPYANLNHIGMAYATFSTNNLEGYYASLVGQVDFVSPPAVAPNGEKFVFLRDQDGTFLKVIEESDAAAPGPLVRLVNTNMNVADLERSREFYRLLGFTQETSASQQGGGAFAGAHGFAGPIAFEGLDVSLPGNPPPIFGGDNEATLQLRQWDTPFNFAPPYDGKVNHLGIDRIAFFVDDLNATIAEMDSLGFAEDKIGPFGGGSVAGGIGIVFYYDPDGIKVEFWGPVSEPNPDNACPPTPNPYPGYPGDED